jgi:hypothetical protein
MKKIIILSIIAFAGLIVQAQLSDTGNSTLLKVEPLANIIGTEGTLETLNGFNPDTVSVTSGTNVTIDGQWNWMIYYSAQNTHITGYRITNNTSNITSGTLKLKLYFTSSIYSGGSISGWVMFDQTLGQLSPNYYFYNIDYWSGWVNPPGPGIYYSTLVLLEYDNGAYYIIDYLNFPNQVNFNTSGIEDLINNNEISISQIINSNSILIQIPQSVNPYFTLKVFDINGKIAHQAQLNDYSNTIDLSFLNNGIYIPYINYNKNSIAKQKIIITK